MLMATRSLSTHCTAHPYLPGDISEPAKELRTGDDFIDSLGSEPLRFGSRVYVTGPDGKNREERIRKMAPISEPSDNDTGADLAIERGSVSR